MENHPPSPCNRSGQVGDLDRERGPVRRSASRGRKETFAGPGAYQRRRSAANGCDGAAIFIQDSLSLHPALPEVTTNEGMPVVESTVVIQLAQ
jgi:hypothetical protein